MLLTIIPAFFLIKPNQSLKIKVSEIFFQQLILDLRIIKSKNKENRRFLYTFLKFGKKFSQDFQINEMNALA